MRRLFLLAVLSLSCSQHPDPALAGPSGGTALGPATSIDDAPHPAYADVRLGGTPFVRQKPDFCGEACVAMATARLGRGLTQDQVFNLAGVDPALGRGAYTAELRVAIERAGFDPGPVWEEIDATRARAELAPRFEALHADLVRGFPSIVCMHYDARPDTTEHFRLITGYDAAKDEVIYEEPAEDGGGNRRMARSRFLSLWPLKYRASSWTVIRFRMKPATGSATPARRDAFDAAAFAQHVLALRRRVGPGFTVVVEPPFVVVGDEPEDRVRERAKSTVRWATTKLKADYFAKDPASILDVYLFRDRASYEGHARAFFGSAPTTPYGYYSAKHQALVMNIATGGGTLVHEIVHPFVEANFPGCPPWFNEGLGSLYEQSGEEGGHIVGYLNWRLAGLKRSIARGTAPPIVKVMAMDADAFYGDETGSNYAVSRYLLYYLQSRGLLVRYYRELTANHAADPHGIATLRRVLGEDDLDAFDARWRAFIAKLGDP